MAERYSDLQVVPPDSHNPKYLVVPTEEVYGSDKYFNEGSTPEPATTRSPNRKRICGLPIKTFWIATAILAIVIIAAAIGGGVGGSLSNRKNSDSTTSSSSPTSSLTHSITSGPSSSSSSTTSSAQISTSTLIGTVSNTTYTLLVDCPSSNWTIYTPPETTQAFRKICSNGLQNQDGIGAVVNTPTPDLDECIDLCAAYNVQNAAAILAATMDICNAVCWRSTILDDDWPGQCFGYSTRNSSGNFVYTGETRCSGAALINQ